MSTARAKYTFVVLIDDHTDADALSRRMNNRQAHLAEATRRRQAGIMVSGGAILDSHEQRKMVGSSLIIRAESEQQVLELLRTDPYTVGGAWNLDTVRIYPYVEAEF
ncbi:hypothetical protein COEREDRAFT_82921 [Coemansia reversa NRRL 1564]|uniref:YCII-related domain-containing protein n=1 Tax=Coemansia reversa (strain ATCC 12441 / NRRL 1564) TaxID=763665 RepID=A0A2G5B5J7_COERN|nr:hypothetical protein COEREDRAFT_82921 [Coemansia reversa NRRL 1564]|eukprot:PIA14260.1 hypothetical protein COEREDRAFT_82921 [Coemansia reversa NRRL 1564]